MLPWQPYRGKKVIRVLVMADLGVMSCIFVFTCWMWRHFLYLKYVNWFILAFLFLVWQDKTCSVFATEKIKQKWRKAAKTVKEHECWFDAFLFLGIRFSQLKSFTVWRAFLHFFPFLSSSFYVLPVWPMGRPRITSSLAGINR